MAKTHRELLVELGRVARRMGRPWLCMVDEAEPVAAEVGEGSEYAVGSAR